MGLVPAVRSGLFWSVSIFFHLGGVHILVGSSNLTYGGLISNIKHNLAGREHLDAPIVRQWMDSYESLWSKGLPLASFEGKPRPHFEAPGGEGMEIGQPFPAGIKVTVYGRIGEILKAEPILDIILQDVDLAEIVMEALRENKPPEATAEQAARAAEERIRMLEHLDKDLLMEIRHYDREASVQLLNRVREASVTNQDIQRFSATFLTTFGARIRPTVGDMGPGEPI